MTKGRHRYVLCTAALDRVSDSLINARLISELAHPTPAGKPTLFQSGDGGCSTVTALGSRDVITALHLHAYIMAPQIQLATRQFISYRDFLFPLAKPVCVGEGG
jgi:hypothetical protein